MDEEWPRRLASTFIGIDYEDWKIAVVVDKSGNSATIGFPNGTTGTLPESAASMPYRKTGSAAFDAMRSEEHTSELQSLMRISYAVFCLKKKKQHNKKHHEEK